MTSMGVKTSYDFEVEEIFVDWEVRQRYRRPRLEYLVKWNGLPNIENSWEPV